MRLPGVIDTLAVFLFVIMTPHSYICPLYTEKRTKFQVVHDVCPLTTKYWTALQYFHNICPLYIKKFIK